MMAPRPLITSASRVTIDSSFIASLDQLPESGAWVIALPMKIAGGSGGPLRIVALLP